MLSFWLWILWSSLGFTEDKAPVKKKLPADEFTAPVAANGVLEKLNFIGRKRIDTLVLTSAISLRPGKQFSTADVRKAMKDLYGTGYFNDVRVDMKQGKVGKILTFRIQEKPAVREIKFSGHKEFKEEILMEVVDILPLSILNRSDVNSCVQRIRDKYIEKGFYLVEVKPIIKEVGNDLVSLTFSISEKPKVAVQRIEFTGNDSIPDWKIRRFMQTRQIGILPFLTGGGTFNEAILENDLQIVRSVFMEEGFADAKVDRPHTFLSVDKKYIYITINVEEGPKYKLGKLAVRGDFVKEEGLTEQAIKEIIAGDTAKDLRNRWRRAKAKQPKGKLPPAGWEKKGLDFRVGHPPLVTGETFKLSSLQLTMQEITKLYGDQGYAFANVFPVTKGDPKTGKMNITFEIQRGEKVRIGRIDIFGNDPTYDKVIRREIPINEGDLYSGSAIDDSRRRLKRLGFFEDVNITTPRSSQSKELDMKVEVTEQPTGSFSVGAGFSNMENFMFNGNISKNNFLGRGYVLSLATNMSRIRQQGNVQVFNPYFLDSRWTFRIHGYSISRQFIEDEYQRGGSIAVGRYLDRRDDIRLEFDYTFEDTGLSSIDPYKQKLFGGQLYRNGITSTGGISLVADKRNNRINATRGIYMVASSNLSGGFQLDDEQMLNMFGGDFNFYELRFNFRGYYPVVKSQRLIFKYNGTIGHLGSTDGRIIPFVHRYRAGGINSIRGYNWFTLGPFVRAQGYLSSTGTMFLGSDDPTAADDRLVVGGTKTFINNFELESPIIPQAGVSVVSFFDAGNAFGDPWGNGSINLRDMRMAYGFGIRWISPMGPLRFEWGFPVGRMPDERAMVFDFSMGSLF